MKAAAFEYVRARSADEAIALVADHGGFAKFVAGGQTLGPMINLRLVRVDKLVDISRLAELQGAAEENGHLVVGAGTPHAAFEDGLVPDVTNGMLRRVGAGIAYRAVRNRGTVGGSLAHADPSAEWVTTMTALGAAVRVRGRSGRRDIAVEDLVQGPMTTVLGDDELVEQVKIPRLSKGARWGFDKRTRKVGEFAHSLAAVVIDPQRSFHRVVIGATGDRPIILEKASQAVGQGGGWRAGREAEIQAAYEADLQASGLAFDEYDHHVHGLSVIRAAKEALS